MLLAYIDIQARITTWVINNAPASWALIKGFYGFCFFYEWMRRGEALWNLNTVLGEILECYSCFCLFVLLLIDKSRGKRVLTRLNFYRVVTRERW